MSRIPPPGINKGIELACPPGDGGARRRSGFSAMVSDYAGTEILAYLLNLQFRRIPIDIMAARMQTD